jgi:hypothetical protein
MFNSHLPFPLARIALHAAATVDPTLNLCTRYPILLTLYIIQYKSHEITSLYFDYLTCWTLSIGIQYYWCYSIITIVSFWAALALSLSFLVLIVAGVPADRG